MVAVWLTGWLDVVHRSRRSLARSLAPLDDWQQRWPAAMYAAYSIGGCRRICLHLLRATAADGRRVAEIHLRLIVPSLPLAGWLAAGGELQLLV